MVGGGCDGWMGVCCSRMIACCELCIIVCMYVMRVSCVCVELCGFMCLVCYLLCDGWN